MIPNQKIKLAIVGVSGNDPLDKKKLCLEHMIYMTTTAMDYIKNVIGTNPSEIILVSGGSAWADHVAVQLYLTGEFAGIELYLPSRFDIKQKKYINTHEGRKLNSLHAECQEKTGVNVFEELTKTVSRKAVKVTIQRGFLARNTLISKNCDYLVAFTFNPDSPQKGGTFDTWKKTTHKNKMNYDLSIVNTNKKIVEV